MNDMSLPIQHTLIPIENVRFVKELYPRIREDEASIERYRSSIDLLPPIYVARDGVLVDGFHRWQAHKREERTEIASINLGNLTDAEIRRESIARNADHGQQLSKADKKALAGSLWLDDFSSMPNGERTEEIATLLKVSTDTVERWTKDARKLEKERQQDWVWDLWLNCLSTRAIEEQTGVAQKTVSDWIGERKTANAENRSPPESRQHFDIWNFPKLGGDSSYFGRMPPPVVENMLWLFTEVGDIVVDPFVGGGTTIDVAKAMSRRVWASDLKPYIETLPIHKHDILTGWPEKAPKEAKLIILDPPYWKQAEGRYSDSPDDLGNMSLDDFYAAWHKVVGICKEHLAKDGLIAYIISPTQLEDRSVVDHATDMLIACREHGLSVHRRIIVPYQTQQATGQQVEWARDNKLLLKLYRDLVVMKT